MIFIDRHYTVSLKDNSFGNGRMAWILSDSPYSQIHETFCSNVIIFNLIDECNVLVKDVRLMKPYQWHKFIFIANHKSKNKTKQKQSSNQSNKFPFLEVILQFLLLLCYNIFQMSNRSTLIVNVKEAIAQIFCLEQKWNNGFICSINYKTFVFFMLKYSVMLFKFFDIELFHQIYIL